MSGVIFILLRSHKTEAGSKRSSRSKPELVGRSNGSRTDSEGDLSRFGNSQNVEMISESYGSHLTEPPRTDSENLRLDPSEPPCLIERS
jgi:hypothetical protein